MIIGVVLAFFNKFCGWIDEKIRWAINVLVMLFVFCLILKFFGVHIQHVPGMAWVMSSKSFIPG